MSSQKEDQAFVHHLLITHGVPIFVSGLQEYGEDVIPLCRFAASLIHEMSKAIAHHLHSFVGTATARCRPAVWQW